MKQLFSEVEFKYSADNIELSDFHSYAKNNNPVRRLDVSGFDHYFVKSTTEFLRYRVGGMHELTIKRKLTEQNNFMRTELNLKIVPEIDELSGSDDQKTLEKIDKFAELLGYKHNFTIFKTCSIYYYDKYDAVYYIVYDTNMKELGRFFEIEMLEHYPWESNEQAYEELKKIERGLKETLGLTAQDRIRKSLFEMNYKPLK